MDNDNSLVIEKDGKEVVCDVCFSYVCEDNLKGYIVFTDHSIDEDGKEALYVRSYDPEDSEENLSLVTDEEFEMTIEAMNKIESKL